MCESFWQNMFKTAVKERKIFFSEFYCLSSFIFILFSIHTCSKELLQAFLIHLILLSGIKVQSASTLLCVWCRRVRKAFPDVVYKTIASVEKLAEVLKRYFRSIKARKRNKEWDRGRKRHDTHSAYRQVCGKKTASTLLQMLFSFCRWSMRQIFKIVLLLE